MSAAVSVYFRTWARTSRRIPAKAARHAQCSFAHIRGVGAPFVYILRSDSDPDRHYVGRTADVDNRLAWHNAGRCGYTRKHRPWSVIVSIRNRDMMPVVAKDLPGPPRAEAFLGFLEKELIPEIERAYRTAQLRILQGKSLSGLFTVYALLARPTVFNAYVGCSAGWFTENNDYFLELGRRAFRTVESFASRRVFMANSLRDQNDPDRAIHRQMVGFSELIKRDLGETISYRSETYEDYPHGTRRRYTMAEIVPKPSPPVLSKEPAGQRSRYRSVGMAGGLDTTAMVTAIHRLPPTRGYFSQRKETPCGPQ